MHKTDSGLYVERCMIRSSWCIYLISYYQKQGYIGEKVNTSDDFGNALFAHKFQPLTITCEGIIKTISVFDVKCHLGCEIIASLQWHSGSRTTHKPKLLVCSRFLVPLNIDLICIVVSLLEIVLINYYIKFSKVGPCPVCGSSYL